MRKPFHRDYPLTQEFGVNPSWYTRFGLKGHNGLDYGLPNGTEVLAPHSGKIIEAANDPSGYGNYLKIENDKEGSVLAHLQVFKVNVNDSVKEGQVVALSDNTGNSTGPHLHWGYYTLPRDRGNGFNGFINQLPLLLDPGTSSITLDGKTFEKLVSNSTKWDDMVGYLEINQDPALTSFDTVRSVIAGFRSRSTDLQNQLSQAQAELKNREEQTGRLKDQVLREQELRESLTTELNKAVKNYSDTQSSYEGQIKQMQGVIDGLAKDKGTLNQRIAELESEIQRLKSASSLSIADLLGLLFRKFRF